jgi:hypothetical protein
MFDGVRRFTRRDPLIEKLLVLLTDAGCDDVGRRARWIARRLEVAGRGAGEMWLACHERQGERDLIRSWLQDSVVRTHLVTESFDRNVRKLGANEAKRRALRHWNRSLLARDRVGVRVPVPRRPTWAEAVGDALIDVLEEELGRPLLNPRRKETRGEIALLVEAFALVVQICKLPTLLRGKGVRHPESGRWFASRITTRAAKAVDQNKA